MTPENETINYIPPAVELKGVSKTFHSQAGATVEALTDINAAVKPGEFVCLICATGCGKTTLLNIIAGLETADAGQTT